MYWCISIQMSTSTQNPLRRKPPKHERVRELLRERIMTGAYPPGMALPPETELPQQLRVSKITVVRALNDLVREGLIVRRRGRGSFVADPELRPLIPGRFLRLGVLMSSSVFSDFRFGSLQAKMLQGALAQWGLSRTPSQFPRVRSDEPTRGSWVSEPHGCLVEALGEAHEEHLRHPSLQAVREARYDGLLALSIIEESWLAELLALRIPTVLVDYPNERFALEADQVFFDPLTGYRAAVKAFVERGLTRIHFVGCLTHQPYDSFGAMTSDADYYNPLKARLDPDTFVRQSAWRQALDEAGIAPGPDWAHRIFTLERDYAALATRFQMLPETERPQAVLCHSLTHAARLVELCRARGFELAGAGAGEAPLENAQAIRAEPGALGRTAAALLLWKLQQPERPVLRVGVPMTLDA